MLLVELYGRFSGQRKDFDATSHFNGTKDATKFQRPVVILWATCILKSYLIRITYVRSCIPYENSVGAHVCL